ncbi:MAG: DNA-binding protein WhiA [Lachnospiraceae bacterium]|nr:DNA-binding protein WhiA [Lachnospiraceae bacterium]
MSFNRDVKNELKNVVPSARHCQLAEIAAILSICGIVSISTYDTYEIEVRTENSAVADKYNKLLRRCFHIVPRVLVRGHSTNRKVHTYIQTIDDNEEAIKILKATKLMGHDGDIKEQLLVNDKVLIQRSCCKRAFLRGCFLATGSITDPEKGYHFEIVANDSEKAEQIKALINGFLLDAKIVVRKNYYVVYLKEGAQIVDALNIMEAHKGLMELENIRVMKEMRNKVNRRVNCETANINKTVSAAVRQLEDIRYIKEHKGFSNLSESLRQMAELRLREPDAPLKDLGQMLNPPVGKSGVNHRLRKLSNIANELRKSNGDI